MKQYVSFFRIRFAAGLQYRVAALAGVLTQFAWGGMTIPAAYRDGTFPEELVVSLYEEFSI